MILKFSKNQVFNIAPQMRTYNDAAARQYWLPYITYATYPLLRSPVLNTDKFGLRHSLMGDGSLVTLNDRPEGPVSVILGSSIVFGIGCESDAGTMASHLCLLTGKPWVNFGVRSYTISQNLIFLLLHQHLLGLVDEIILVVGRNELYSFIYSSIFMPLYGAFPEFISYIGLT